MFDQFRTFSRPWRTARGSQGNLDCVSQYLHTRFDIRSCQRNDFCGHLRSKKCTYCEAAHLAFCRILQVDPETCKNLVSNLDAIRPERTRDIVLFSVRVAVNPNGLGDADYKKLKQHGIDDSEIIEIVAMAAFAT